jgi:hypothetical protein
MGDGENHHGIFFFQEIPKITIRIFKQRIFVIKKPEEETRIEQYRFMHHNLPLFP